MRIIKFGVNNFRGISGGIENNTIEFLDSNTIFILGQNNVGKSSFLRAYEVFYANTSLAPEDLFRMDSEKEIEFELSLQLDDFDFEKDSIKKKEVSLKKWLNNKNQLRIKRVIRPKAGAKLTFEKSVNYTWNFDSNEWIEKSYGGIGLDTVFQSALPTPVFIKAMPSESEVEEIVNKILSEKATQNLKDQEKQEFLEAQKKIRELQDKIYNPAAIENYKSEVNQNFQSLFPNTKIELAEKDKIKWTENGVGRKFTIHFEQIDNDGTKDQTIPTHFNKIGHGAIRSAIFSLLLMKDVAEEYTRVENRKDYLVLFEEPELFLHPKLMKQLRALIYSVSSSDSPYQVLCASHSPQMINITKERSSLVRMVSNSNETKLHQINDEYLRESKGEITRDQLKQEMNEILRFNPFICESFYADEVILIEGATEEIILRGYLAEVECQKDLFIVNCGSVTNIPFYQKIFSKFSIKYHVICDTDNSEISGEDEFGLPIFEKGIQKSIYNQFNSDARKDNNNLGLLQVHQTTFEPAHQVDQIPLELRYPDGEKFKVSDGKPFNANLYWRDILQPNLGNPNITTVPIIHKIKKIIEN